MQTFIKGFSVAHICGIENPIFIFFMCYSGIYITCVSLLVGGKFRLDGRTAEWIYDGVTYHLPPICFAQITSSGSLPIKEYC